ncbi:hypothetical protein L1987_82069 [Smallanthus sonchifolius]|uniref:Uncharacterized protein n=1 Tax=Smallanthus sonchifolius TaxID=185202 RepID=A0ACB8YRI7_9ASTR|nr:hypothetical protein L1987_82069 [Smallanthus sonchifolius]
MVCYYTERRSFTVSDLTFVDTQVHNLSPFPLFPISREQVPFPFISSRLSFHRLRLSIFPLRRPPPRHTTAFLYILGLFIFIALSNASTTTTASNLAFFDSTYVLITEANAVSCFNDAHVSMTFSIAGFLAVICQFTEN